MAITFKYVSAVLCQDVLHEASQDGLFTLIRLADVFQIPHDAPPEPAIRFFAVIQLKTAPVPDTTFQVSVFLTGPSGNRERLPDPVGNPFHLAPFRGDPSIPTGIVFVLQLNVIVKRLGTGYLDIEVDDETVVTIPFTTLRLPPPSTEPVPQ